MLEVDLDAGSGTVAFHVENHPLTELAMTNATAQAHAWHCRLFGAHAHGSYRTGDLNAWAYLLDELLRYFLDEPRRNAVTVNTMQAPLLGVRQKQALHCPRHSDITQAPLFLEAVEVIQRALVWKKTILHAAEEHHRELQPFGRVQSHHLHAILPGIRLPFAGFEHGMGEECFQWRQFAFATLRGEAARGADELIEVLDPRFASIGLLPSVVLDQTATLQHVVDLFVQRESIDFVGEPLDQSEESMHAGSSLAAQLASADAGDSRFPQ